MKRIGMVWQLLLALYLAGAGIHDLQAQATVRFANTASAALTNGADGQRLPVGGPFRVSLYAGPVGSPEGSMALIAGPIGIGAQPGLYNGGNVAVPGLAPGAPIQLQVRAWDSQGGTLGSYEAAAASSTVPLLALPKYTTTGGSFTTVPKGGSLCPRTSISLVCPATINYPANPATNVTLISYTTPSASSSCIGVSSSVPVTCFPPSGSAQTNNTSVTYTCTAADGYGREANCSFVINVGTPPRFSTPPIGKTSPVGGTVTLSAQAAGSAPLQYQWTFDGQVLTGATNASLFIPSVAPTHEGLYMLTVFNTFGVIQSRPVALSVLLAASNSSVVAENAFWRYLFEGSDPGTSWRQPEFNDDLWPGGRAELGFGDSDETTVIGQAANGFITAYFRRSFLVANPAAMGSLLNFQLRRDDGAVVYLNGVEVYRNNMPTGLVTQATLASGFAADDGAGIQPTNVTATLRAGLNTIAVEMHQSDATSTDMTFALSVSASSPSNCLSISCPAPINLPPGGYTNTMVSFPTPPASLSPSCPASPVTVLCSPPSGSRFPNNSSTTVTCTATDTNNHFAHCVFTVTVNCIGPTNTVPLTSKTVLAGGNVAFSATFTGTSPISYQWFHDGLEIAGATNSSLTILGATPTHQGVYYAQATSYCGTIPSKPATLTILRATSGAAQIPAGEFWRYKFDGGDPGSAWTLRHFDDEDWAGGWAKLGFGDGDEATVIGSPTNHYITAYFRRPFLVGNPTALSNLFVALRRDDGGIVYLNGVEVFRSNMPGGAVNALTLASQFDPEDGVGFRVAPISPGLLVTGTNLLAAEVHQFDPNSSDLSFDLQLVSFPSGAPPVNVVRSGANLILKWNSTLMHLQSTTALRSPAATTVWLNLPGTSPLTNAISGPSRSFRLAWP